MRRKLFFGIVFACLLATVSLSRPLTTITVSISPTGAAVTAGADRTFTATVMGAMNSTAVSWAVNGIGGGNATIGTVSATGNYKAPAVPPPGYTVTLSAASVEDNTAYGTASIYVTNVKPTISSISPWCVALGPFSITVSGSNLV